MAKLIYSAIVSLDGYVADEQGKFDWSEPDEEVHAFINDVTRPVSTFLLGRRMYEILLAWETMDVAGQPPVIEDFAQIWRAADKVVYSTTLETASTARTRIERVFEPDGVRQMKAASGGELAVGGPQLAAHAIRAGLVDEYLLFVSPLVVGGGKPFLPDDVRLDLDLMDEHSFDNGVVYLRYRPRT